jgi:hypothetical protein
MYRISTTKTTTIDYKLRVASIAGVYAPLILILTAALVLF